MAKHKRGEPTTNGDSGGGFKLFMAGHLRSEADIRNLKAATTSAAADEIRAKVDLAKAKIEKRNDPVLAAEREAKKEKWKERGRWVASKLGRNKTTPVASGDVQPEHAESHSDTMVSNEGSSSGIITDSESKFYDAMETGGRKKTGRVSALMTKVFGEGNPVSYLLDRGNTSSEGGDVIFQSGESERIRAMHEEGARRAEKDRGLLGRARDAISDFGKPKIENQEG